MAINELKVQGVVKIIFNIKSSSPYQFKFSNPTFLGDRPGLVYCTILVEEHKLEDFSWRTGTWSRRGGVLENKESSFYLNL